MQLLMTHEKLKLFNKVSFLIDKNGISREKKRSR